MSGTGRTVVCDGHHSGGTGQACGRFGEPRPQSADWRRWNGKGVLRGADVRGLEALLALLDVELDLLSLREGAVTLHQDG